MARIGWQTGRRVFGLGRKSSPSTRSFPTDGEGASDPGATVASRVMRGPTQVDRDNLPYVQEAWEWAFRATRTVGLRRRNRNFPCVLDILTRMRVAALVERRNLVWPETAATVAGLDLARLRAEHHACTGEVEVYVSRARGLLAEELDEGWDGVVWGDIDPADPFRSLELDYEVCEGCGRCVVVCPQAFTRSADGEVLLKHPDAVREKTLEGSCLEALSQCPEGAIKLNSRGGRTATGVLPPRGRPLPGEREG